jgi:hypothetical protein
LIAAPLYKVSYGHFLPCIFSQGVVSVIPIKLKPLVNTLLSVAMRSYALWLLGLTLFEGLAVVSLPSKAQLPLTGIVTPGDDEYPIISRDTAKYFDHLRRRYGIKGLSIALVAAPSYTRGEEWVNQTISLGEADIHNNKVTDEVSHHFSYGRPADR